VFETSKLPKSPFLVVFSLENSFLENQVLQSILNEINSELDEEMKMKGIQITNSKIQSK